MALADASTSDLWVLAVKSGTARENVLLLFSMNEADTAVDEQADQAMPEKISPSQFMRNLQPEHYSDTEDRAS